MTEFVVDFLPPEARRRGLEASSRRRTALLLGLLGAMVCGVAAHSWNRFREAESRRAVSLALTTNATRMDDVMDRLAHEQQELGRYLAVHDRLALPVEPSDIVATVTHLMPDRTSLSHLRLHVREDAPAAKGDAKTAAGPRAAGSAAAEPAAAPAGRWIDVHIRGYAAGNAELYEFERRLAGTAPFGGVTVSENRPIDVPGAHLQEFSITCRIDLPAHQPRPGHAAAVATRGTAEDPR